MKITRNHVAFWRQHKQPLPSWADEAADKMSTVSIHSLIPNDRFKTEPHNTISILKSVRARGGCLVEKLELWSKHPGCCNGVIRSKYCKKWLRKILASRN